MSPLPKVLLLGDSIRKSYEPHVRRLLAERAEVVGPDENGQYSLYTLHGLDRWIRELGRPDVVHWNNGIHDVGHNPERDPVQFPPDVYRSNLAAILDVLQKWTPRIIWAATTPVHPARPFREDQWSWRNREIEEYNQIASNLMQAHGIAVNDLYRLVLDSVDEYLGEDQLHLSSAGERACARAVVKALGAYLS